MDVWSTTRAARPVADAPMPDAEALAKAWLLALIARAPLREAGGLPAADLAREAPALCAAIVAALRSDAALARLRPGGDLADLAGRAGSMAGARDPAAVAAATDALGTVTWGVLRDALPPGPDPRLVADLAERVALVGAVVADAALRAEPLPAAAPAADGDAPFLVHDARSAERDPWLRPVDFALARHARDGTPFAVVLADLDEVERLVAAEVGQELADAVDHVEQALRGELRGDDAFVRERIGRYWIVAGGLDRDAARGLAGRMADAVGAGASLHGAPLAVSLGLALCPGDGEDADALAAHADEGVFAARAAGTRMA